jgi:hypothetical protein
MPKVILSKKIGIKEYIKKRGEVLENLSAIVSFRSGYADEFYPFPILHSAKEVDEFLSLQSVLVRALKQIVKYYFTDKDIYTRVPLSKKVAKQLRRLSLTTYHIGGIRPDYIYSKGGIPMICEINARFIFNALYMTIYMDEVFKKMFPRYKGLQEINKLGKCIRNDFKDRHVAVIKDREDGYDIHSFLLEHPKANLFNTKLIKSVFKKYSTIILELHQDEVEKHLKVICDAVLEGKNILNDPRTLFMVHDKRLLSVLSNEKIMKKYISLKDAQLLKKHIVPTYVNSVDKKIFSRALRDKKKWVAKKAISGKADGLYIGKEKSIDEWKKILKQPDTLLQVHIEEKKFRFYDPLKRHINEWYIAGTLPIWNEQSFGPGLYRVSHTHKHDFARFIQPMII